MSLRPEGKPQAGYWEFPGGKLAPGETAGQALKRELHEELGIEVQRCHEWLTLEHDYADKHVSLAVWTVVTYTGEVAGHGGAGVALGDARPDPAVATAAGRLAHC